MRRMTSDLWYRRDEDRGTTAVLVGVSFLVLVGIAAFVLDIGNLFWERRSLQNGADAAALAVAQDCAGGDCGDPQVTAAEYASANNPRGAHIRSIEPEDVSPEDGEVTVTAETGDEDSDGSLATWFASVIGTDETATSARATAVWEAAGLDGAAPVTASLCDYFDDEEIDRDSLDDYAGDLPSADKYVDEGKEPETTEQILLHDQSGGTDIEDFDECTAQPGFSEDDDLDGDGSSIRAGFGWLESTDCEVDTEDFEGSADEYDLEEDSELFWAESSGGVGDQAASCIANLQYEAPSIPVFIDMRPDDDDSWPEEYLLYAPAAFYITDYRLPGSGEAGNGGGVGSADCEDGSNSCIEGVWVQKSEPPSGDPGNQDLGVRSVRLEE